MTSRLHEGDQKVITDKFLIKLFATGFQDMIIVCK